ncbi:MULTISPECIES: hypothetical protein [Marinomonas]|nr:MULTISPECIES: hypothetical protein [Marinomonas]
MSSRKGLCACESRRFFACRIRLAVELPGIHSSLKNSGMEWR